MIKITRCECPSILANVGDIDRPTCKSEVVEALHKMQFGKCCYCEKHISKNGNEQAIEHFRPKADNKFPELKNEWTNLLHSCADCNGKKSSQFPVDENGAPLIIDPSNPDINPGDHIEFYVDAKDDVTFGGIHPKDGSRKGRTTIKKIGLDLVQRRWQRKKRWKELLSAYADIKIAANENVKTDKIHALEDMLRSHNEFAAFSRAWARYERLDSDYGVRIPSGDNDEG